MADVVLFARRIDIDFTIAYIWLVVAVILKKKREASCNLSRFHLRYLFHKLRRAMPGSGDGLLPT